MTTQTLNKPAKDHRLDILRVIAMIMVVFVHVANYYCRAYSDISSASYLGAVIFNTVSRVSVPVFFMISGMLLLSKPVDLRKNTKRIIDKLIYLLIITGVYLLWDIFYMGKSNINFWGLITNPERTLLWFMYAIIGIYIALPFMRRMVENMTKREDVLFIMLWITCNGVLHLLKFFFNLSVKYPVPILNGTYYLGYFMVGYLIGKYRVFIEDYFKKVRIRCMGWSLCTLAFVATVCFTYFNSVFEDKYFRYFLKYNSLFTIIASVAFFILVYTGCKNKSNKLIKILATNSFEVYLFHGIILDFVMINTPFRFMNSFWGIPLLSLVIFIVTFLGVSAVKSSVLILKKRKL